MGQDVEDEVVGEVEWRGRRMLPVLDFAETQGSPCLLEDDLCNGNGYWDGLLDECRSAILSAKPDEN